MKTDNHSLKFNPLSNLKLHVFGLWDETGALRGKAMQAQGDYVKSIPKGLSRTAMIQRRTIILTTEVSLNMLLIEVRNGKVYHNQQLHPSGASPVFPIHDCSHHSLPNTFLSSSHYLVACGIVFVPASIIFGCNVAELVVQNLEMYSLQD